MSDLTSARDTTQDEGMTDGKPTRLPVKPITDLQNKIWQRISALKEEAMREVYEAIEQEAQNIARVLEGEDQEVRQAVMKRVVELLDFECPRCGL